jgi:hypothetical protein
MRSYNKPAFLIFLLFIVTLGVLHTSNPDKTVNAQAKTNFLIHDVLFDAETILSANPETAPNIQLLSPEAVYEYIPIEIAENVLELEGALNERIYLPFIDNNYVNFFDDFSNPNSGFPIIDTSTNNYQYVNGEYQILNKTNSYLGAVTIGNKLDEFHFEVSMRRIGNARGLYGIVFWLDETWSDYYLFLVSPDDGELYFYHYKTGSGFSLQTSTQNYQYVKLGNTTNRIGMKQFLQHTGIGFKLTTEFLVNGFTFYANLGIGKPFYRVGLVAAPIDANHQVLFDDYLFENYCEYYPGCQN